MKTIFKDKNITHLKNFIFLSDGTPVVLYTKFDYEQNFVLIDDQEFGPFESADIYANIYGIFDKSAQTEDFSDISEPEVFETEDPWIRKDGDFVYFETGKKSFGPFKAIWEYQILDSEHFQFLCILPVDDYALHYVINGKYITDIPLKKALSQTNTKYIPYFAPYCHLNYSESGKALLYDLPDNCMYIDGKKTDFFNGKCFGYLYSEKNGHVLVRGKLDVIDSSELDYWYSYDGQIHKNWVNAELLDDGTPVFTEVISNENKKWKELIWFCGNKQISIPVDVDGYEKLIIYGGSLIYYLREGIAYIMMKGVEHQGFAVNNEYAALLIDGEIKLYHHKDEFVSETDLAIYLSEHNLLAGLDKIKAGVD